MNYRSLVSVLAAGLLVVPLIIVQAQTTEGDASSQTPTETPAEAAPSDTPAPEASPAEDATQSEQTLDSETTPPDETVAGEVLGSATETSDAQTVSETLSRAPTDSELLQTESASSTASSTELVIPTAAVTDTRTVFLQPSVEIGSHLQVGQVTATITLQNLTCRFCDTSSPSVAVKAFYVPWFDNDGATLASTTDHQLEQTYSISPIAPWQSVPVQWSGEITTAGRYSFIVLVDPDNLIGARDTYRTEFFVD